MKAILLAVTATPLVALLAAAAPPAKGPTVSFEEALAICKLTFIENPELGRQRFNAVPDDEKRQVAVVCLAYRRGALDLMEAAGREPENVS